MPCFLQAASTLPWSRKGWHSIWSQTSGSLDSFTACSSKATVKFDTPICRGVALALHLGHRAERLGERHARVRPVDQQQVDGVEPQLRQAPGRALELARRQQGRRHLGGDEDLVAHAGGAHALAHRAFVVVHLRGVDVAVAERHRLLDQPRAFRPRSVQVPSHDRIRLRSPRRSSSTSRRPCAGVGRGIVLGKPLKAYPTPARAAG